VGGNLNSGFFAMGSVVKGIKCTRDRIPVGFFSTGISNTRTRTSTYVGTGPANILGERTPCKNRLICTLDKVIYFKGTIFEVSTKLSSLRKIGWRSAEKNYSFFQTCFF
jgi:hypothetical protein